MRSAQSVLRSEHRVCRQLSGTFLERQCSFVMMWSAYWPLAAVLGFRV